MTSDRKITIILSNELLHFGGRTPHQVAREVAVRVSYKGHDLGAQRIDMIVNERLIIEVKATHPLQPRSTRQLLNYLKATNLELGLLLHFGPKANFYRVISSNLRNDPLDPRNPRIPT